MNVVEITAASRYRGKVYTKREPAASLHIYYSPESFQSSHERTALFNSPGARKSSSSFPLDFSYRRTWLLKITQGRQLFRGADGQSRPDNRRCEDITQEEEPEAQASVYRGGNISSARERKVCAARRRPRVREGEREREERGAAARRCRRRRRGTATTAARLERERQSVPSRLCTR